MMLYALIVDDEPLMRRGIESALDWSQYGIQEVASAPNGRVALQMIEERQPDLILTDVRMPGIDGLELSRLVKERWSHIRIVIISGFDDFSYAKKSISYGVTDYILKPIDGKSLGQAVEKAVMEIMEERRRLMEQTQISRKLHQTVGIARQKVLKDVLFGETDASELSRYEHVLGLDDAVYSPTVVALVHIRSFKEKSTMFRDGGLLHYAVHNITDELLRTEGIGELVDERLGRICMLLRPGSSGHARIDAFIMKAQGILNQYLRIQTTWATGGAGAGIQGLRSSYREASSALLARWFVQSPVLSKADLPDHAARIALPHAEALNTMAHALRIGNTDLFQKHIETAIAQMSGKERVDPASIETYFTEMAEWIVSVLNESNPHVHSDFVEQVREALFFSDTLQDMLESVTDLFRQAYQTLQNNQRKPYSKVIRDVIEYLHENYRNDISLADAANHVELNRSYLSFLFVQETGSNFSEFLQSLRLEKAKELLRTTLLKNYEVAEAVGYSDFRYFGQIFKKHTGMTPGDYRKLAPS